MTPDLDVLTAPNLSGIRHGYFARSGGVSVPDGALNTGLYSSDDPELVKENRARVSAIMGAPLVTARQVHSPDVLTVSEVSDEIAATHADALVTATPGIAIGVLTADCGPILFADPVNRIIGAAHAGWKGAKGGVLANTVSAMEALGADRTQIHACLGPTIGRQSYEVSADYRDAFLQDDPLFARFFVAGKDAAHYQFDLPAFILSRLDELNLASVADLGEDTCSQPQRFFSYRRACLDGEPDYHRHVATITLTE